MTQAFNLALLANNLNTSGQLDASDGLVNAVPVANGGTGQTSLTSGSLVAGNGTSAVSLIAPGTSGNVLTSNGSAWTSAAGPQGYTGPNQQFFTASGTFTVPSGVTSVKVTVVGGGAQGYGLNSNSAAVAGSSGGTTSFGAYISATGGVSSTTSYGVGTQSGNFNAWPGKVGSSGTVSGTTPYGGRGGAWVNTETSYTGIYSIGYFGGATPAPVSRTTNGFTAGSNCSATTYGGGGGGAVKRDTCFASYSGELGGGGGGVCVGVITGLTPGTSITVTIGAGGSSASATYRGGNGAGGACLVEW